MVVVVHGRVTRAVVVVVWSMVVLVQKEDVRLPVWQIALIFVLMHVRELVEQDALQVVKQIVKPLAKMLATLHAEQVVILWLE